MGQRGYLSGLVIALVLISSTTLAQDGEPLPLAVELDIPDYLPNAEEMRHPRKFFSGQPLRLRGDFFGLDLNAVQAEMTGRETGTRWSLQVLRATLEYVKVAVPPEIPTDVYDITLLVDGRRYQGSVQIHGFSEEELRGLEPQGEGAAAAVGPRMSAAILYTSELDCGGCYWEHVLAGHPTNPDHLVLTGVNPGWIPLRVSHDGGRTWAPGTLERLSYYADPRSLVTPDGNLLLVGHAKVPHPIPTTHETISTTALWQGPVIGNSFQGTWVRELPDSVEARHNDVDHRPDIAYDPTSGTIYILAYQVLFNDGRRGGALFLSTDGGHTFSMESLGSSRVLTLDIFPGRDLYAARSLPGLFGPQISLLLFGLDGSIRTVRDGPDTQLNIQRWINVARLWDKSDRQWIVWTGPEIAVDKSPVHPGRIYVLWSQPETMVEDSDFQGGAYGVNFDVFLSYSDDEGRAWSEPLRINDDHTTTDQVFPSIGVDSEGIVHVSFLDKRENPSDHHYDVYYARVVDGKVSRNIRVNPDHIPNWAGGRDPGDYLDSVVGYPTKAYVSYPCGFISTPDDACISAINPTMVPFQGEFIRGDSNGDLVLDIADPINTLSWLFLGTGQVPCQDAADANDDGQVELSDAVYTLSFLFLGGPPPPNPFPGFGEDQTRDQLSCN